LNLLCVLRELCDEILCRSTRGLAGCLAIGALLCGPASAACPLLSWQAQIPVPPHVTLPQQGPHPRLHFTQAGIAAIRTAINSDSAMRATWNTRFLPLAAAVLASNPAHAYPYQPKTSCTDDQEWMRDPADDLAVLAFAYAITRDAIYLEGAQNANGIRTQYGLVQYLTLILGDPSQPWSPAQGYASWGNNNDIATSTLLQGIALAYDWVGNDLSTQLVDNMRAAMLYYGNILYQAAMGQYLPDTMGSPPYWATGDFPQGHVLVNVAGLLTAALALADPACPQQNAEISPWIDIAVADLASAANALGPNKAYQPDGASQEGISYAGYALEALLRATDLSDQALGTSFQAPSSPLATWLRLAPAYYLYLSLPHHAWVPAETPTAAPGNTALSLGDNPSLFSRGPDYLMRRLAGLFPQGPYAPAARGFASTSLAAGINGNDKLAWLNFVWNPPAAPEAPLSALPTLHAFPNYGFVSTRSDWSGDESLLLFAAGPPLGFTNVGNAATFGAASHVHPYQNGFYVFGAGQYILPNIGYETPKFTQNENTLRIDGSAAPGVDENGTPTPNGIGQLGENATWFAGASAIPAIRASMRVVHSDSVFDYLLGDATTAYPASAGLARYQRGLIFLKQADAVIAIDDIAMRPGVTASTLALDFHPATALSPAGADAWTGQSETAPAARIRLQCFDPLASTLYYDNPYVPQSGQPPYPTWPTLTVARSNVANWQDAVAISWSSAAAAPATISGVTTGNGVWSFAVGRAGTVFGTLQVSNATQSATWKAQQAP
jgi:hypothetical protein